ncbi:hypothetical protein Hamer_G006743 [Homarus americanus]|uniref:Uncharacterized protein n=1 Tax=Homarus americanus TaxID=6706 RepID=A0A8J5JPA6_HOMAM|nr:hypothetical protein Hamer_G006743 [Homarus americanus]
MTAADEYSTTSHVLQLCLALQDRLEKVEKEVQSLKGENLALKLVLEEKKTLASVVKDGEVEVDSWKVVAASATKCTIKRHSAVDLNNRFSTLSNECEESASNTTSTTPSVSVERGSSAASLGDLQHLSLGIPQILVTLQRNMVTYSILVTYSATWGPSTLVTYSISVPCCQHPCIPGNLQHLLVTYSISVLADPSIPGDLQHPLVTYSISVPWYSTASPGNLQHLLVTYSISVPC